MQQQENGLVALQRLFVCHRYIVRSLLGQGTFGQVVECTRIGPDAATEQVAVKVIKNQSAYFNQVSCFLL